MWSGHSCPLPLTLLLLLRSTSSLGLNQPHEIGAPSGLSLSAVEGLHLGGMGFLDLYNSEPSAESTKIVHENQNLRSRAE